MSNYIERTVTELQENEPLAVEKKSCPLENYKSWEAYVVLGAPGAGKTELFRSEAEAEAKKNQSSIYITARNFITLGNDSDWQNKTLFIDGLDEMRAGTHDGRTPLDKIRKILRKSKCKRFRISCRGADWFGSNDKIHLEAVLTGPKVKILHLDPLSDTQIREFLKQVCKIDNIDEFIDAAQDSGIQYLLGNPQNLKLLAKTFFNSRWPQTRREIFESACKISCSENNQEHKIAEPDLIGRIELLDIAGRLCALQLLAGYDGIYFPRGEENPNLNFLSLDEVKKFDSNKFHNVLSTNLFSMVVPDHFEPVHKHIAEFLAGRYLSQLLDKNKLPINRILSLMTGEDGGIVSEMRGIAAWIAAHNKIGRSEIIDLDPLGVVSYGDIASFSTSEKQQILEKLAQESRDIPWLLATAKLDSHLGLLASNDMADYITDKLSGINHNDYQLPFVELLICSIAHNPNIPDISTTLVHLLRSNAWPGTINYLVLSALESHADSETSLVELKTLADEIFTGKIPDDDDSLLGKLLRILYPRFLSPTETLGYLRTPKQASFFADYFTFWNQYIPENSTESQLAQFIDELASQCENPNSNIDSALVQLAYQTRESLLYAYLLRYSSTIDIEILFNWLCIARDSKFTYKGRYGNLIREWVDDRPEIQIKLLELGAIHYEIFAIESQEKFREYMNLLIYRLSKSQLPKGLAKWCLNQAISSTNPQLATYSIQKVAAYLHFSIAGTSLTRESVEEKIKRHKSIHLEFQNELELLEAISHQENKFNLDDRKELEQERREWWSQAKQYQSALLNNECPPEILYTLSKVYLGDYLNIIGQCPEERLRDFLNKDDDLIKAVMFGIKKSPFRKDLPDEEKIYELAKQNQIHYLSLPYLIALSLENIQFNKEDSFGNFQNPSRSLAFYFSLNSSTAKKITSEWISDAVIYYPETFAALLIKFTKYKLKKGAELNFNLALLAYDPNYRKVSGSISLSLLEGFPVRCVENQLPNLANLLVAMCLHCQENIAKNLIEKKLLLNSMNLAQKIYWLTCGLFISPDKYLRIFRKFVNNQQRVSHLIEFLSTNRNTSALINNLNIPSLQFLVETVGPTCRPRSTGSFSTETMVRDWIHLFIDKIASKLSTDAQTSLESLKNNDNLNLWKPCLLDAIHKQRVIQRNSSFTHYGIESIQSTLQNEEPSNIKDLSSLTVETIEELGENIRNGNTSDWRQYWNTGSHKQSKQPKNEELCRDAFLSDLKRELGSFNVDAQPEGYYADDKRADIRVSHGKFNIPIEIKKSDSEDLWTAIKKQLIKKYMRDPGASGYGIYLVFWFGNQFIKLPDSEPIPKSAETLKQRLEAEIPEEHRKKISVCVIDVSNPIQEQVEGSNN